MVYGLWRLRYGSYQLIAYSRSKTEMEAVRELFPGSVIAGERPADPYPRPQPYFPDQTSGWGPFWRPPGVR